MNQWVSLGANLGVVVGLAILIYELQQNRLLVRAELGSEATTILRELQLATALDQEMSSIIAKVSFGQVQLSDSEIVRLDAYLEASVTFLHRDKYLLRLGVFEDDPAFLAGVWTAMFLNNPAALKWWDSKKALLPVDTVGLVDAALATERAQSEATQLIRFRSDVNSIQE